MSRHCPDCGCLLPAHEANAAAPKGKPRSLEQLKRHHAVARAAYDQWPHTHPRFRPKSPDHLRYWAYCQIGHCEVIHTINCGTFDLPPDQLQAVMFASLLAVLRASEDEKTFLEQDGSLIVVKKTGGASYAAMRHLEACNVFEEFDQFIAGELGIDTVNKLLERAA